MEMLILSVLVLLLVYGYFYTNKLAKKFNRNGRLWMFYYLLIGPLATIFLTIIGKKEE